MLHILKEWGVSNAINSQHQLPEIEPGRVSLLELQRST
jgi:hypothetical protein